MRRINLKVGEVVEICAHGEPVLRVAIDPKSSLGEPMTLIGMCHPSGGYDWSPRASRTLGAAVDDARAAVRTSSAATPNGPTR